MKKILPYIGLISIIILLEISWSSFVSFQERSYFFLFSLLAILVVRKGFLKALPFILFATVLFEGITQSTIGFISFYGLLFSYAVSFLLKRVHLEHGMERVLLSLAVGIGIALYPVFLYGYMYGWRIFSEGIFSPYGFLENIVFGGICFLTLLYIRNRSEEEMLPLASSFSK